MTYCNPPLLAEGLEKDDGKMSVPQNHLSHKRTHTETMQPLHAEITTALATMPEPDSVPQGKGLLINRNFAWLASGQAISNLGDFVYSTTLFIWVYTLTHSAAAVSGVLAAQY